MPLRRLCLSAILLAALANSAGAQELLRVKFTPGETRRLKQQSLTNQSLMLAGQDLRSGSDATVVAVTTVGEADAAGLLPVRQKVESLTARVQLPGGVDLKFDSREPNAKSDNPVAEVILDALRKQAAADVRFTVDRENQVGRVEGIVEGSGMDAANVQADQQQALRRFPDQPVTPGDSWERSEQMDLGGGQKFTFQRRYEFAGLVNEQPTVPDSRKLAKITSTDTAVKYTTDGPAQLLAAKKSDLKVESSSGTILLDVAAGHVVQHDHKARVTGPLTISVMGQEFDAVVDVTIEVRASQLK